MKDGFDGRCNELAAAVEALYTQKNEIFLCISLGFHYLCRKIRKLQHHLWTTKLRTMRFWSKTLQRNRKAVRTGDGSAEPPEW